MSRPNLTPSDAKLWSWGYVLPIQGIFAECSTRRPFDAKLGRGNKIGCILGSLRNLMSLGCTLCLTLSIFSKLPNLTNHSLLLLDSSLKSHPSLKSLSSPPLLTTTKTDGQACPSVFVIRSLMTLSCKILLVELCPSILQCYCAVEYQVLRCRLLVYVEVANALELQVVVRLSVCQVLLYVALCQHLE